MEYRIWITVPGIPHTDEARWEPLAHALEHEHAKKLGPVLSWEGSDLGVTLATDAADEAEAADIATHAVTAALHDAGLGDHYPATCEVEPADGSREPVTA